MKNLSLSKERNENVILCMHGMARHVYDLPTHTWLADCLVGYYLSFQSSRANKKRMLLFWSNRKTFFSLLTFVEQSHVCSVFTKLSLLWTKSHRWLSYHLVESSYAYTLFYVVLSSKQSSFEPRPLALTHSRTRLEWYILTVIYLVDFNIGNSIIFIEIDKVMFT